LAWLEDAKEMVAARPRLAPEGSKMMTPAPLRGEQEWEELSKKTENCPGGGGKLEREWRGKDLQEKRK
jgi:hypothetical protein